MHSKKFSRGVLVLSIVACVAAPIGAFAEESPIAGKKAMTDRWNQLNAEVEALEARIDAEEAKKSPDEALVQSLQDQIDAKETEMGSLKHDLTAGSRKYAKVVRDEKEIAKQQKIADEASAQLKDSEGASLLKIAKLRGQRDAAQGKIARLKNRIARKGKAYKKKLGEDMPVRCQAPEARDPGTNTCRVCAVTETVNADTNECVAKTCPKAEELNATTGACQAICTDGEDRLSSGKCAAKCGEKQARDAKTEQCVAKELTAVEKRQLAGCWDEEHVTLKKIYSIYPLGKAEVKVKERADLAIPGGTDDEISSTEYFMDQVKQLNEELGPYGRISRVMVSSYASRAPFNPPKKRGEKTPTPRELAKMRSDEAVANLFAELAVDHNRSAESGLDPKPLGLPYRTSIRELDDPKKEITVGAAWAPGDVKNLSDDKIAEADYVRRAKEILAPKAPFTPVRALGGTPEENLAKTVANLKLCCRANKAALKFKPYQYSQIVVAMPKYTPDAPACGADPAKVSTATATKAIPTAEVPAGIPGDLPGAKAPFHSGKADVDGAN